MASQCKNPKRKWVMSLKGALISRLCSCFHAHWQSEHLAHQRHYFVDYISGECSIISAFSKKSKKLIDIPQIYRERVIVMELIKIIKRNFVIFCMMHCTTVHLSQHACTRRSQRVALKTKSTESSFQGHSDVSPLTRVQLNGPSHRAEKKTTQKNKKLKLTLTTLWVCVCPIRISMFEQIIDKQKLSRMMDRSERIYLNGTERKMRATEISAFLPIVAQTKQHHHVIRCKCRRYLHSTA